jgi:hypothetical protein
MTQPPDRGAPPSTPRWVKIFGLIAIVLIVIVVVLLIGGEHGPGRHFGINAPENQLALFVSGAYQR